MAVTVGSRMVVTARDLEVLRFAADQFAVPMPLAAELARRQAPSRPLSATAAATVARRLAVRLEAGRLARRVVVAGQVWLVPTGPGLALAAPEGEDAYDVWHPTGWKLEHVAAVARLRLWLAGAEPTARWECERAIRRRWAAYHKQVEIDTHTRYADGGLHFPDGTATGVEVELHVKPPEFYRGIVADQDDTWTRGVWWFTPRRHLRQLRGRLEDAGARDHQVIALSGELAWVLR